MISFLCYSLVSSDGRLITSTRDNAPNASLRLNVIEEIVTEDLKLRNWQGDRDRAMKGLNLRMGESPTSAVNWESRAN